MTLNNIKIWSITDGSQGMISQANGLSKAIGKNIIEIKAEIIFPWNKLQPGFIPIYRGIFKNIIPENNLPDMIISCGRKSVYLSLYLKKKYKNIINIHIQNPKISLKKFNFIVAPNHDGIDGTNVIKSIGALHQFCLKKNYTNNKLDIPKSNLISCLIGGQNQHYHFNKDEAEKLCERLLDLKKNNPNRNLLIITSRRTEESVKKLILNKMKDKAIIWTGEGKNPYSFAIENSEIFIITSDSTSMISESAITGNPIYIFNLPYKRRSKRLESFHKEFKRLNITRDFENITLLDKWNYKPLNETKRIAGIIKQRIIEGI